MPKVRLKLTAQLALRSLPAETQRAVDDALLKLRADAYVGVRLRGNLRGKWKLRAGAIRIIYRVLEEGRLVVVDAIVHRGDAYPRQRH